MAVVCENQFDMATLPFGRNCDHLRSTRGSINALPQPTFKGSEFLMALLFHAPIDVPLAWVVRCDALNGTCLTSQVGTAHVL